MKFLAWTPREIDQTDVPSQSIEEAVYLTITEKGMQMPPVREGWFAGGQSGGQISSERFPGSQPIWYWEVK